jgi:hypothetical protein
VLRRTVLWDDGIHPRGFRPEGGAPAHGTVTAASGGCVRSSNPTGRAVHPVQEACVLVPKRTTALGTAQTRCRWHGARCPPTQSRTSRQNRYRHRTPGSSHAKPAAPPGLKPCGVVRRAWFCQPPHATRFRSSLSQACIERYGRGPIRCGGARASEAMCAWLAWYLHIHPAMSRRERKGHEAAPCRSGERKVSPQADPIVSPHPLLLARSYLEDPPNQAYEVLPTCRAKSGVAAHWRTTAVVLASYTRPQGS